MNVLYISPAYHPIIGGAETHVRLLAEGMVRRGHTAAVLTDWRDPDSQAHELINGVEIFRTARYRKWRDEPDRVPWEESLFGLLREFGDFVNGKRFDIVHGHCQVSVLLGAMIAQSLGRRLIATMHETQPELDPFGEGRSQLVYAHVPYDGLIACSQFFRDQALRYGAPPDRIRLIYYGVDLNRFSAGVSGGNVRARLGLNDGQPLVVLVGRFKARKGILEFVRAVANVRAVVPHLRGLIVGTCNSGSLDYANAVRSEIDLLGLAQVVTIEESYGLDDMPQVYAAADLVVQPSHAEGFGISVLEALAAGKPVVGTNVSGIQEIITDGQNGLLVPPQRVDCLAQAMSHLLLNRDEATRLAGNGHARVKERFGIERMISETHSIYSELVARAV